MLLEYVKLGATVMFGSCNEIKAKQVLAYVGENDKVYNVTSDLCDVNSYPVFIENVLKFTDKIDIISHEFRSNKPTIKINR